MESLSSLAIKYEADKYGLGYIPYYEEKFESIRNSVTKLLEIGIALGDSQKMWLEYFPNAMIYGMDNFYNHPHPRHRSVCEQFTRSMKLNPFRDRFIAYNGDQENINDINNFISQYGGDFDIIIDDGGHTMKQHQVSLGVLFEVLKPGGIYIIEDLHTCSGQWKQLYGCETIADGDTLTTEVLKSLGGLIPQISKTNYIDENKMNYIKSNVEKCKIEVGKNNYKDYKWPTSLGFIEKRVFNE